MANTTEQQLKDLTEKHNLTKEYLRRALIKLQSSIQLLDIEEDGSDEYEEEITKFVNLVKRKKLI